MSKKNKGDEPYELVEASESEFYVTVVNLRLLFSCIRMPCQHADPQKEIVTCGRLNDDESELVYIVHAHCKKDAYDCWKRICSFYPNRALMHRKPKEGHHWTITAHWKTPPPPK